MARPKKTPKERIQKLLGPETCAEIEGLDATDLRARISRAEGHINETETMRNDDEGLAEAVTAAKELAAPYKDAIKRERAVQRYCQLVLAAKGKD